MPTSRARRAKPKPCGNSSTVWTRRSCSSARSIPAYTTVTRKSCARNSHCFASTTKIDELDVEGILAFAERVLPRAADRWVQASLAQRQLFQQLFFPEEMTFDGRDFVGTAATTRAFNNLQPIEGETKGWWADSLSSRM